MQFVERLFYLVMCTQSGVSGVLTAGAPESNGRALLACVRVSRSPEQLAFISVHAASLFILKGRQLVKAKPRALLLARI